MRIPNPLPVMVLLLLAAANSFSAIALDGSQLLVSPGTGAHDDIQNGGFESTDNDRTFYSRWSTVGASASRFESWRNYRFPDVRIGRNTTFPSAGKYRGIVNSVAAGPNVDNGSEPSVNTYYRIQTGDKFTLSFKCAGALGWTRETGLNVVATLYYDDDGNDRDGKDNVIDRVTVTPTTNANQGEGYLFSGGLVLESTEESIGKIARLRFQTDRSENLYAVIDDVSLSVLPAPDRVTRQQQLDSLVTVQAGELPIILSAPHGGRLSVADVPERRGMGIAKFNSRSDSNTDEVTVQLADALEKKFGKRPYVVIARFHRKYVDANRRPSAAYESEDAAVVYEAYHQAIDRARRDLIKRWGRGLLLDVHGQASEPDAIIRGTRNGRTITHLVSRFGRESMIGKKSLFGQLATQNFRVIPAVDSSAPEHKNYSGGHIVGTYGSGDGGTLDAIQLELGKELRSRDSLASTTSRIADATAKFAQQFLPLTEQQIHESKVHVGVYIDEGAGRSANDLLGALAKFERVTVTKLDADEIRGGNLAGLDILIQPGGSGGGQGRHLGKAGREEIRGYVRDGGGFIGICAGAYLASAHYDWSLNILDAKVIDTKHWNRGKGSVQIALTDIGKDAFQLNRSDVSIYYAQGPLLAPGSRADIADYQTIATFETEIAKNGAPVGVMKGTTAIASGQYGSGRVLCFSPHPEMTDNLESFVLHAINYVKRNR